VLFVLKQPGSTECLCTIVSVYVWACICVLCQRSNYGACGGLSVSSVTDSNLSLFSCLPLFSVLISTSYFSATFHTIFFLSLSFFLSLFLSFVHFFVCSLHCSFLLLNFSLSKISLTSSAFLLHPQTFSFKFSESPNTVLLFTQKTKVAPLLYTFMFYLHKNHKPLLSVPFQSQVGDIIACIFDQFGNGTGELVPTCLLACINPVVNQNELPTLWSNEAHDCWQGITIPPDSLEKRAT